MYLTELPFCIPPLDVRQLQCSLRQTHLSNHQVRKYFRGDTTAVKSFSKVTENYVLPTITICPYHGFDTSRMERQLNLSEEFWNIMWNGTMTDAEPGQRGRWSDVSDEEDLLDLWESSVYPVHELLHSLHFWTFNDGALISRVDFLSGGGNVTLGEHLSVEEKSSVLFGRCAIIKTLGRPRKNPLLTINLR